MMSSRLRLGVGLARAEGLVVGLALLAAALTVNVEAASSPPSCVIFDWPARSFLAMDD